MSDSLKPFQKNSNDATPILRCVVGVTLALMISTTIGYMVPHITAIFVLMFLGPTKEPLGLKKEIGIVIGLCILGYLGVFVGNYLIDFPLVLIPVLGLIVFWSFKYVRIPEVIRLLFLLLIILIPFVSLKANMLGGVVLEALLLNLLIAMAVTRIAFFVFPSTADEDMVNEQNESITPAPVNLNKIAFNGLAVLMPIILLFYIYSALAAVLILVFAIILSFEPFIYQSKKGPALIAANVIGGAAAILAYNILVIAPSYMLYIFVILSVAFYFVGQIFSGRNTAPLYRIGFNTFFVIMGVISTSTEDASSTIGERVVQIGLAITYVIVAFRIANTLNNPKLAHE